MSDDKTLKLHPLDKPLRGEELKSVGEEIQRDEQAAKARDSGTEIDPARAAAEFSGLMNDLAHTPDLSGPMTKPYQVWQADRPTGPGEPPLDFPEAYTKVATVEAASLDDAFRLTNHLDRPWQDNLGVEGKDGARSTSVGDVIVDPDGKANRVERFGFSAMDHDSPTPPQKSDLDRQLDEAARQGKYQ